jgi:RNA polymerase sigma factor (sigma-70 family)
LFVQVAGELPVELVRARKATADDLARLYGERGRVFTAVAASVCGESAPDAVQDAFVRALSRIGTLRSRGALESWVWRIVLNEARRRSSAPRAVDAPELSESPDPPRTADPRVERVRALVAGLPLRQREVVFLRYFADLDQASIASALGIRRGTVAATLHRVHDRIRAELHEGGIEP